MPQSDKDKSTKEAFPQPRHLAALILLALTILLAGMGVFKDLL